MNVECIITIGGDGTILRVARTRPKIPILPINKGRKGFMTEIQPEEIIGDFQEFLKGNYNKEEHNFIEAFVDGKKIGMAINEIVITSVDLLKPIDFQLIIDGFITSGTLADGIIVATPVGSTGHCLSAGGCMIDPSLNTIEIAWINPINLATRPIVLNPSRNILIRCSTRINPIKLVFDGQISSEYMSPVEISYSFSKETVKFYRSKPFIARWRQHLYSTSKD